MFSESVGEDISTIGAVLLSKTIKYLILLEVAKLSSPENVTNPSIIRNAGEEQQGDYLHWAYTLTEPNIGYNLSTNDKISFMYIE